MTKLSILIVEDEPFIAMLMSEVLGELGHDVCGIAATEIEAIEAASVHRPDLMIVDAHLRHGSGIAAMARILNDGFVPHIFVSGDRLTDVLAADAIILQKPFMEHDLVAVIDRAMVTARGRGWASR